MKFLIFIVNIFLCTSATIVHAAADNSSAVELTLIIENIKTVEGKIFIAIFDNDEDFMRRAINSKIVKPKQKGQMKVIFELAEPTEAAISIYHDADNNEKLNRNFIGLPSEPYGFTNNPRLTFGPPSFKGAKVYLITGKQTLRIVLK